MAFRNNNAVLGIPEDDIYQVGASDVDPSTVGSAQKGFLLPFPADPSFSWVYYECNIEAKLDSGIVVHNRLPQVDNEPDSLGACDYSAVDLDKLKGGVNLVSRDRYADIVQRMSHSRYWFRLYGQAIRVGFQVPIPSLKMIGGVPAIPHDENPQRAYNRILPGGNYGGVIMWHAVWSLWYTTAVPPRSNEIPAADPSSHTKGTDELPEGIQVPFTQPDDNAVSSAPPDNRNRREQNGVLPQQSFNVGPVP